MHAPEAHAAAGPIGPSPTSGSVTRLTRDAVWLIASTYVAQVVTVVLSIALRRELGPEGIGYVALTQLTVTYAPFLGLGTIQVAERDIAIELGRGRESLAAQLETTAATVVLGLGACAAIIGLVVVGAAPSDEAWTIRAIALVVVSQQVAIVATVRLRTRLRFRLLGIRGAVGAVLAIVATLVGAVVAGTRGAVVGAAIGSLLQATILSRGARVGLFGGVDLASLRRLTAAAPGFLAVGVSAVLLSSVDQLAVAALLGSAALGIYSTAYLGNVFLMRIPNLAAAVVYPRLQRHLGAHSDPPAVHALARRTTNVSVTLLPLLTAALFIALPVVVHVFLPTFVAAIDPMRMLLVGVSGLAFAMPATQVLVTLDRQWVQAMLALAGAAIMAVSYGVAALAGGMTIGVAATVDLVVYAVYGITVQLVADRSVGSTSAWLPAAAGALALPLGTLLVAASLADAFAPGTSPAAIGVRIAVQGALFAAAWVAAAALYARPNAQLVRDLRAVVRVIDQRVRS